MLACGKCYNKLRRVDDAREAYQESVRLAAGLDDGVVEKGEALAHLGWLYFDNDANYTAAASAFEKAYVSDAVVPGGDAAYDQYSGLSMRTFRSLKKLRPKLRAFLHLSSVWRVHGAGLGTARKAMRAARKRMRRRDVTPQPHDDRWQGVPEEFR